MKDLEIPPVIRQALEEGAALALSLSGGKDSQAELIRVTEAFRANGWLGPLFAIHAHLGRAEWKETLPFCEKLCADLDLPFVVVSRPQGDLVQEIKDRMEKLAGRDIPHWPSSASRYCTSDQKRGPIDKVLRAPTPHWPSSQTRYCTSHHKTNQADKVYREHRVVISAEGVRGQESRDRSKKRAVTLRKSITAKPLLGMEVGEAMAAREGKQRVAINWYPLFDWTLEEVWNACGTSGADLTRRRELFKAGQEETAMDGWPCHPAYVWGNERLSCAICVLASRNDITNGARRNPELYETYVEMERKSGYTFRQDLALATLFDEKAASQPSLFDLESDL